MEIRVYKTGEDKKIDIRGTSFDHVKTVDKFKDIVFKYTSGETISIFVEGESIVSSEYGNYKDFSGNNLGSNISETINGLRTILLSNSEVDSFVIGDDLSQKSSETIFTHNKAGTSGLGGRLVVDNDEAKLDITRSTGQGETSVTVSAENISNYDRGTITGKVAWSNGTQDAFTVQGGNPGLGAPQFTINGRLIAENGIYVGSGGGTELAITDLDKVPASLGSAGQVLAVNSGATALEFVNQSGGSGSGSSTLLGLTDTPSGFGSSGQVLVVNAGRTAMEFATPLQIGTTSTTALAGNTTTITSSQALAINANSAKTSFPGFGTTAGTALEGNTSLFDGAYSSLTGIPSSFTPSAHNQAWTTITGTPTTISGYGITDALQLGTTSTTALAGDTTTITSAQASAITANTAKTSFPGFGTTSGTALEGDTALLQLGTTSTTALAGDTTTITSAQASAITANTAKTSFPGFGTTAGTALEGDTVIPDPLADANQTLTGNRDIDVDGNYFRIKNGANIRLQYDPNDDRMEFTNGVQISGDLVTTGGGLAAGQVKLQEPAMGGSNGVILKAPSTNLSADVTFVLPDADGSNGQVLQTDGSGNLSFSTVSSGGTQQTLEGQKIEFVTRSSAYGNGAYEGKVMKFGTATLQSLKLYQYISSGWSPTDANQTGKAEGMLGLALGTSESSDGLLLDGLISATAFSGFSAGDTLYVSETESAITNTAPTASGSIVRIVGYALGSGYVHFNPSDNFIELA